jgi:branched-chain amino acid transport system permease protein
MSMRPSGVYSTDYSQDQALFRTRVDYFWLAILGAILVILPQLSSQGLLGLSTVPISFLGIVTDGGILLISITGLNLLLGYTGQISLGQAAFMMVGAYSSAVFTKQTGLPFLIALPLSALVTGGVGLLFGLASLRVKGFYLAMATLAAQFIIPWAITNYSGNWVYNRLKFLGPIADALRDLDLGGQDGMSVPAAEIFGFAIRSKLSEYYLVMFFVVLTVVAARNMVRSRLGRAWISVRDNDLAAEQLGINVFRYKLLAFFISAIYAGIAGSLLAHVRRSIGADTFDINASIEQLGMLVIGGAGFVLGPFFGIAFFLLMERWLVDVIRDLLLPILPDILTFRDPALLETSLQSGLPPLLFGLFLAIFLIFQPRGIAYRWLILQAAWRLRPFSKI